MMTNISPRISVRVLLWAAAPLIVFLVLLLTLERVNGSDEVPAPAVVPAETEGANPAAENDPAAMVASLESAVEQDPANAETRALLGDAFYQQYRETADPSLLQRAQQAVDSAIEIDPANVTAVIDQGTLALTKHDFSAGLEYGLRAHRLSPALVRPYNLIADAQIELGRYNAAGKTLQRFVDLKPSLAAYSRVSYFRELHGDIDGATQAMKAAVSTGGGGEPLAYVQTLLGNLEFNQGRLGAAELQYRQALVSDPTGYIQAAAGLAQVDAARGSFDAAIRRYRQVVDRLPLPQYAIALADTELAAGEDAAAKRDLGVVQVEEKLFRSAGVNVDTELAIFEADHGQAVQAVRLGAHAWRQAPSVRSADAYSWALNSAGRSDAALAMSRRAMRLGSRDPLFLYHAGQIARSAGKTERARRLLGRLVEQTPDFSPLYGPRAERALAGLQ